MNIEIELKFPTGSGVSKSVQAVAAALEGRNVDIVVTCNHVEIGKQYKGQHENLNVVVRRLMGANLRLPDLLTLSAPEARDHVAVLQAVNVICQRMHDLERMTANVVLDMVGTPRFSITDCDISTHSVAPESAWVHGNRTAVRVRHMPTNLVETASHLRSVHANREAALRKLEERVNKVHFLQGQPLSKPTYEVCQNMTRQAYGDLMTAAQANAARRVIAEANSRV